MGGGGGGFGGVGEARQLYSYMSTLMEMFLSTHKITLKIATHLVKQAEDAGSPIQNVNAGPIVTVVHWYPLQALLCVFFLQPHTPGYMPAHVYQNRNRFQCFSYLPGLRAGR